MAIAHTQTEQTRSPTITPFTIQCACQNRLNSDMSEEAVSGRADCAMSAGFMSPSFRLLVSLSRAPAGGWGFTRIGKLTACQLPFRSAFRRSNVHARPAGNPAKGDQTRASGFELYGLARSTKVGTGFVRSRGRFKN